MSNRVFLTRMKFVSIRRIGGSDDFPEELQESSEPDYGFTMSDDYAITFNSTLDRKELLLSDEDFLYCISWKYGDDVVSQLIDYATEHGMFIDDAWYESEWVRKVFVDDEECDGDGEEV